MSINKLNIGVSDKIKLKILKGIYEKDGVSLSGIKSSLKLGKKTANQNINFLKSIGAIETVKTYDGNRPRTGHHITNIGIHILFNVGEILKKEFEKAIEQINENIEPPLKKKRPTRQEILDVVCDLKEIVSDAVSLEFINRKVLLDISSYIDGFDKAYSSDGKKQFLGKIVKKLLEHHKLLSKEFPDSGFEKNYLVLERYYQNY